MSFIEDFKKFAFKGNLIDMAVGIVMGGAVAAIVQSFIKNIITPLIAGLLKVPDLSEFNYTLPFGKVPKLDAAGKKVLEDGKEVLVSAELGIGSFIQNVLDFAILAFVIFIALKVASKFMSKAEAEAPPAADIVLLTEIRDALKK